MQFGFNIDMQKVGLRNVSLFLSGLALIRDGLELTLDGGIARFIPAPNEARYHVHFVGPPIYGTDVIEPDLRTLSDIGKRLLIEKQWPVSARGGAILLYDLLSRRPPDRDIRLVTLHAGTLDGVIDDVLDMIGDFFGRIFHSSTSKDISHDIRSILEEVTKTSRQPDETKFAGVGLVIIGIEILKTSYEGGKVSKVEFWSKR